MGGSIFLLVTAASCQDTETEAVEYLTQFGYIPTKGDGVEASVDITVLNEAVKDFQIFTGLDPTGKLDSETIKLMKSPRCGNEDRVSNYVLGGSKWKKKVLTYSILNYPTAKGISKSDVDQKTREAFDMWEEVTTRRFKKTNPRSADIKIKFSKYNHGDGMPFDGKGGNLAHAFYPQFGGDVHLDDSELWSVKPNVGTQILQTLAHQFGHSLGLSHSQEPGSFMAPLYKDWDTNLCLGEDDKKGIQALYGTPEGSTQTRCMQVIKDNALCGAKIDAAVQNTAGGAYVFSADKYWRVSGGTKPKLDEGYPKKISRFGLPDNIDAAVYWSKKKKFYCFKGNQYWRFSEKTTKPDPGYPKDISNWSGLPPYINAAFEWSNGKSEQHLFFFKGSQYWKYDTIENRMEFGYPKSISNWKGVPSNVEAVLRWNDGKTYIFKEGNYWRLHDRTGAVDENNNPPFPNDAGQWWFGCPNNTLPIPQTFGFV